MDPVCRYYDRGGTKSHLGKQVAPGVFFDHVPDDVGLVAVCIHQPNDPDGENLPIAARTVSVADLKAFPQQQKGDPDPPATHEEIVLAAKEAEAAGIKEGLAATKAAVKALKVRTVKAKKEAAKWAAAAKRADTVAKKLAAKVQAKAEADAKKAAAHAGKKKK